MQRENAPVRTMVEFIHDSGILFPLSLFSIIAFIGSMVALPFIIRKMPEDYFVKPEPPRSGLRRALRNIVGATLVFAGILMLFLPGQGLLTILVGVSFLSFRKKRELERELAARSGVLPVMNAMRKRSGLPPLLIYEHSRSDR